MEYWKRQLSRRRFVRGTATAGVAAVGLSVVACSGGNNNNKGAATATKAATTVSTATSATATRAATGAPSTAPAGSPTRAGSPAASAGSATAAAAAGTPSTLPSSLRAAVPAPPSYSKSASQKLLSDYHWSKVGADVQVLGTPRKGGVLAFATASFGLQTLHPTQEPVGQWPFCYTHNNLAGMDFSYKSNPDLIPATPQYSVSQSWEQPNPTTIIFKLRPEVTWHNVAPANGDKLTIADVKATYEYFKGSKFHGLSFRDITSIEESSPGFVKFASSAPSAHLLNVLRTIQYPVLNAKHIAEGDDSLSTKAIGTGPFMQGKFQANASRVYKRNPNYWVKDAAGNQLPYADGAVQVVIADKNAELAAFRSGQTDYYRPVSPEEFNRLRMELDTWAQVSVGCGCQSFHIMVSGRDPMFKDVRVRRALSLAVNRQDIVDTVYGGAASAHDWISWYYRGRFFPETFDEMGPWYKYDPQQAKQLLQAAGVAAGTKVDIIFQGSLLPGTGAASGDPYIESIKRDFSAAGIELNLKPIPASDFTTFYTPWNGLFSTSPAAVALDADKWIQNAVTGAGTNGAGLSDPMVDDLFKKQRATVNVNERAKVFDQIEQYVNRDQMLLGVQLPSQFGMGVWRKYNHNMIDTASWWINGGVGQEFAESWQDDKAAKRDINSY